MSRWPSGQRSDKTSNDRSGPFSALPVGRLGESEPTAGGKATTIASHAISYAAFIATVQDVAALATAEEADRAALAALGELVGCVSWTAAQNLGGCLPQPLRRRVSLRSFDSSMCRFAPQAFLRQVARQERVDISRGGPGYAGRTAGSGPDPARVPSGATAHGAGIALGAAYMSSRAGADRARPRRPRHRSRTLGAVYHRGRVR